MTRVRALAAALALFVAGYFSHNALASFFVAPGDPTWTLDTGLIEKQVAQFAKTNAITTQTGWDAFINALTAGQSIATSQGLLRSVKCSNP